MQTGDRSPHQVAVECCCAVRPPASPKSHCLESASMPGEMDGWIDKNTCIHARIYVPICDIYTCVYTWICVCLRHSDIQFPDTVKKPCRLQRGSEAAEGSFEVARPPSKGARKAWGTMSGGPHMTMEQAMVGTIALASMRFLQEFSENTHRTHARRLSKSM